MLACQLLSGFTTRFHFSQGLCALASRSRRSSAPEGGETEMLKHLLAKGLIPALAVSVVLAASFFAPRGLFGSLVSTCGGYGYGYGYGAPPPRTGVSPI